MNKSKIIHINMPDFQEITGADKLVLVDFWAEWCRPCQVQDPYLEEIATEFGDKIIIAKLNVDDNKYIARQQGVRNIPAIILYKKGKMLQRLDGLQSREMIINAINKHL